MSTLAENLELVPQAEDQPDHMTGRPLGDALMGIPVLMQVVVGTTSMPLSKIAALGPGSLVTLDQVLGAPVTVLVNGKPVASGELFVHDSDDGRLGIKIASVSGQKSER